jgi:hypothetical protein
MVTVTIGGMAVPADRANEGWVNQMIAEARRKGEMPCVQVSVNSRDAQVALATPGCGSGGGGGRPPNETEKRIIDAWNRRGLGAGQFSPGELRAFLHELSRLT